MKVTIGRNSSCQILINKPDVSDKHAEVWIDNETIVVEDLDSSNGTFKNSRRIARTELKEGDELKIATVKIPFESLKLKLEEIYKGNDYSKEFSDLKAIYEKYKKDIQALKRKQQKNPLVLRILLSLLPVLASIILWNIVDPALRYVIMVGGSSLVFGLTSLISMGQEKQFTEKMETLSDEFQINYTCPKCKLRLGVVSWKVLASQKKCKICGAIWIKE